MDFETLEEWLGNWKYYYIDRPTQRITPSLEGKYRPERKDIDYSEDALPPPSKPIDAKKAVLLEKEIVKLPYSHKCVIVFPRMYPRSMSDKNFYKTCRIAKVAPHRWDIVEREAKLMLVNRMGKA